MLGFKSTAAARILSGIEMVHMMRKRQARFAFDPPLGLTPFRICVAIFIPTELNNLIP
jgi:hypothetical protein